MIGKGEIPEIAEILGILIAVVILEKENEIHQEIEIDETPVRGWAHEIERAEVPGNGTSMRDGMVLGRTLGGASALHTA